MVNRTKALPRAKPRTSSKAHASKNHAFYLRKPLRKPPEDDAPVASPERGKQVRSRRSLRTLKTRQERERLKKIKGLRWTRNKAAGHKITIATIPHKETSPVALRAKRISASIKKDDGAELSKKKDPAIRNQHIAEQFGTLRQLKDGWCKGIGTAPDMLGLDAVAKILVDFYPEHFRTPKVSPTLDGNLLLEWGNIGYVGNMPCYGGGPSANINLINLTASFRVFRKSGKSIEKKFDFKAKGGIQSFIDFLDGYVPREASYYATDGESTPKLPSLYSIAAERFADIEAGRLACFPIDDPI